MFRSSNPVLSKDLYSKRTHGTEVMTVGGVVMKTFLCLAILLGSSLFTWMKFVQSGNPNAVSGLMMGGVFGGLILALITVFKKEWASITAPLYALAEGLFIGGISAIFQASYPGIVLQAALLTMATLFSLLAAYQSGMIKVTERFRLGIVAATGGIALVYFASIILSFFGIHLSFIYEGGLFGILFSLFVVVIAALNLVLDFDFIEQGTKIGAPKYLEWYASFALMVTLIWLYIEFLRLLSKLQSRR